MEKILLIANFINQYMKSNNIEKENFNIETCKSLLNKSKELKKLLDDAFQNSIDVDMLNEIDEFSIMLIKYYFYEYNIEMKEQNSETINLYFKEIKNYQILSREEEQELFKKIKSGDEEAKQTIICSNLRLVVSIARRYCQNNENLLLDYIQEGNIGLMKAVEKFDITKGFKFSTYATDWIKKYILYYRDTCLNEIKKTSQVKKHKALIDKAIIILEDYYGKKPTDKEISKYTHLSLETINKMSLCYDQPISLNEKLDETKENEHIDFIESKGLSVEDEAINNYIREIIYADLTEEEIKLLNWRYGLQDQKIYTQEEIGTFYGVTKKAICLRENKIKEKLKKKSKLKRLL